MTTCFSATAHAEKRVALVIGNSTYRNIAALDNPKNDAKLMAETLLKLDFALVGGSAQIDLDKNRFDQVVQAFGNQLSGADVGLFYYAGHGVQIRNSNYLVPINANLNKEVDVDFQMVDVALVLRQMEGSGTKLNLVVLDACRNNPFGDRGLRTVSRGLAQMQAPEGTLISYATQPGNVALDGVGGNSPFTKVLADTIRKAGLDIFQTFNEVGVVVKRSTGGAQQPWVSSSPIDGAFYFSGPPKGGNATSTPVGPPSSEAERAWILTKDTKSIVVLEDFVRHFGDTFYASMARARIEELKSKKLAAVMPPVQSNAPPPKGQHQAIPAFFKDAKFLGRFDSWSAYASAIDGKKMCFALAPNSGATSFAFVSIYPSKRFLNQFSVVVTGYQVGRGAGSTLEIGEERYALNGQDNSLAMNNHSEESRMIGSMRSNSKLTIRALASDGVEKTEVYSLREFAQALDRTAQECR